MGPSSSGKTTLLEHLKFRLCRDMVVLRCKGAHTEAAAVLSSLLLSADLAPWDLSEIEQRNLLTVFIQQRRTQGRRVALVIDDVHKLTGGALAEVERLASFRVHKRPAAELLLAGSPSAAVQWQDARERLGLGELRVHALAPASQDELAGYLDWRVGRFELQDVLTPAAGQMIARLSGGRYGAADVLCQMALLLLKQVSSDRVDASVVRQAVTALAARHAIRKALPPMEERRPSAPLAYLVVSRAGQVLTRVALGARTLIGRSEDNDVCLANPYLGRHHAVIVDTPEGYYLIDLDSVNGVLLNGRRVERSVLCDEDVLTIGPFRLQVQAPDWVPEPAASFEDDFLEDSGLMPIPPFAAAAMSRSR